MESGRMESGRISNQANPESARTESGRMESGRMSNSANPESARMDSGRKESGRISDSANLESAKMDSGRKESGRISTQVKIKSGETTRDSGSWAFNNRTTKSGGVALHLQEKLGRYTDDEEFNNVDGSVVGRKNIQLQQATGFWLEINSWETVWEQRLLQIWGKTVWKMWLL
jgi:hypothetical protein